MLLPGIQFLLGLGILLISTGTLVKNAKLLAYKLKLSPLIIGITIVALGTSLPELAVSTISALKHDYGLALGNIVGSNITNILLVLPLGILVGKLRIGTTKTQRTVWMLLGITILFFALNMLSINPIKTGLILLTLGVIVTILEYIWGIEGSTHEDLKKLRLKKNRNTRFTLRNLFVLMFSILGVTLGGILLVTGTETLAIILGYSTTILGLSLTAVVTSLPEIMTTVFSQEDRDEKLTIGNILGSNIYNIALIGGISSLFSQGNALTLTNWIWFIGSAVALVGTVTLFKGKPISKFVGLLLLAGFCIYIYTLK